MKKTAQQFQMYCAMYCMGLLACLRSFEMDYSLDVFKQMHMKNIKITRIKHEDFCGYDCFAIEKEYNARAYTPCIRSCLWLFACAYVVIVVVVLFLLLFIVYVSEQTYVYFF